VAALAGSEPGETSGLPGRGHGYILGFRHFLSSLSVSSAIRASSSSSSNSSSTFTWSSSTATCSRSCTASASSGPGGGARPRRHLPPPAWPGRPRRPPRLWRPQYVPSASRISPGAHARSGSGRFSCRTWLTRGRVVQLARWPLEAHRLNSSRPPLTETAGQLIGVEQCSGRKRSPSGSPPSVGVAVRPRAHHEPGLEGQASGWRDPWRRGPAPRRHRRARNRTRPGCTTAHPQFGVALARAHAGLGRLLGDRLVREDADPDLPTTLELDGSWRYGPLRSGVPSTTRLHGLNAEVRRRRRRRPPWPGRFKPASLASCGA